jgi:outer membrane biosynthesis protein TonB
VKLKVDKTLAASIALHVLVLGWGLISFASRALEVQPEALPVDIISTADLSRMTAGMKTGEKDKPKPLVEKVADAKPVDEAVGKISDKKEVVTSTSTAEPPPKPVEKKPDVKPKEEPKQAEKKPDPSKEDPIAEALKSDEAKKPKPKQEAKVTPPPQPQKPKERVFDQSRIAALIDKRDPTRQSITGAAINPTSSLGTATGNSDTRVATWIGAFTKRMRECFNFPYNGQDADQFEADIDIRMRPDGTVAAEPTIVTVRGPSKSVATAVAESAKRAILQCQAYTFLPKEQYESWKYIQMTFALTEH